MRSYSSVCCQKMWRSICQSFTLPPWVWRAKDSVSYTEGREVSLSPSMIKDTYLTFSKIGKLCFLEKESFTSPPLLYPLFKKFEIKAN